MSYHAIKHILSCDNACSIIQCWTLHHAARHVLSYVSMLNNQNVNAIYSKLHTMTHMEKYLIAYGKYRITCGKNRTTHGKMQHFIRKIQFSIHENIVFHTEKFSIPCEKNKKNESKYRRHSTWKYHAARHVLSCRKAYLVGRNRSWISMDLQPNNAQLR